MLMDSLRIGARHRIRGYTCLGGGWIVVYIYIWLNLYPAETARDRLRDYHYSSLEKQLRWKQMLEFEGSSERSANVAQTVRQLATHWSPWVRSPRSAAPAPATSIWRRRCFLWGRFDQHVLKNHICFSPIPFFVGHFSSPLGAALVGICQLRAALWKK